MTRLSIPFLLFAAIVIALWGVFATQGKPGRIWSWNSHGVSLERHSVDWVHDEPISNPRPNDPAYAKAPYFVGVTTLLATPYWLIAAASLLVPVFQLVVAHYRKFKHLERRAAGMCLECGYDLRATPGQCPECGAAPTNI